MFRQKVPRLMPPEPAITADDMSEGYPSPSLADSDGETEAMDSDQELMLEIEDNSNAINAWYHHVENTEVSRRAAKEIKLKDELS